VATSAEVAAMHRALELAALGPGYGPNPRVGCVVLDAAGAVVGEGYHRGAGTAHAEVDALDAAGPRARGGTAVVTLEPCNHTGRTGPCTHALLAAGVSRVVIAATDPNPEAAGGADLLRGAGVQVEQGVLARDGRRLIRRWLFAVTAGRPFVTWKFAATLDGRSAAADGTSQWITGPQARADVHARRADADAVLVGTGTVLADDPSLTVRDADGRPAQRQPLRVVLGRRPVPATARVLDGAAPSMLLNHRDPAKALAELHDREIRHVWLEGGPTVAAAFWRAGLVDEVLSYLAPALLGAGRAAVADLGITTIDRAARLATTDLHRFGDDVLIVSVPRPSTTPDSE
jgi:diaminohydroxyphosphoribosylaminopyrimidine deaminase/5-amino-6-(5-phosphoribosylamino)uracil reductase